MPAPFREARLVGAPEAFNAVDVHVAAMAEVDQAVVANPAIGVHNAGHADTTANNGP
jgi:hypothetical protein